MISAFGVDHGHISKADRSRYKLSGGAAVAGAGGAYNAQQHAKAVRAAEHAVQALPAEAHKFHYAHSPWRHMEPNCEVCNTHRSTYSRVMSAGRAARRVSKSFVGGRAIPVTRLTERGVHELRLSLRAAKTARQSAQRAGRYAPKALPEKGSPASRWTSPSNPSRAAANRASAQGRFHEGRHENWVLRNSSRVPASHASRQKPPAPKQPSRVQAARAHVGRHKVAYGVGAGGAVAAGTAAGVAVHRRSKVGKSAFGIEHGGISKVTNPRSHIPSEQERRSNSMRGNQNNRGNTIKQRVTCPHCNKSIGVNKAGTHLRNHNFPTWQIHRNGQKLSGPHCPGTGLKLSSILRDAPK